ncbi:hypothetical protein MIMGU_mgv1a022855mg, partial [Erythranthe guttata]
KFAGIEAWLAGIAPQRGGGALRRKSDARKKSPPLRHRLRSEMFREVKFAGIVPVPVAAMTAGSACWSSHSMVSPSDLWPSSRVSWKTLAAQSAGMRMRRPRPSTLVWRSLVDVRFGGGFFDVSEAAAAPPTAAI